MKTLVMEHKSSSEDIGPGSVYWQKLRLDAQASNYLVGARALGFNPDGLLYDLLRKPTLEPLLATPVENRKYTKPSKSEPVSRLYANQRERDETPAEYHDRIIEDIASRPDFYYQRGVVVRLEDEERDAAYDVWQTADQIRLNRLSNRWPRNVDACSTFNRLCDYWTVCSGETRIDDPLRYEKGTTQHPELEEDGRVHLPLVTSSSARSYRSCQKKYYFAYELGMRPRVAAEPLRLGAIIHRALDVWMSTGGDIEKALAAVRPPVYDFEAAKIEAMLRGYHVRWGAEPLEVVAVETQFICDLVNPETGAKSRTWQRGGKIDAIVRTAA